MYPSQKFAGLQILAHSSAGREPERQGCRESILLKLISISGFGHPISYISFELMSYNYFSKIY